jgi:hypothetical protein
MVVILSEIRAVRREIKQLPVEMLQECSYARGIPRLFSVWSNAVFQRFAIQNVAEIIGDRFL